MTNTCELTDRELSDAELDQVGGGVVILPIVAGVAVGAVLGAGLLVGALAAADFVGHRTGGECVWDALGVT